MKRLLLLLSLLLCRFSLVSGQFYNSFFNADSTVISMKSGDRVKFWLGDFVNEVIDKHWGVHSTAYDLRQKDCGVSVEGIRCTTEYKTSFFTLYDAEGYCHDLIISATKKGIYELFVSARYSQYDKGEPDPEGSWDFNIRQVDKVYIINVDGAIEESRNYIYDKANDEKKTVTFAGPNDKNVSGIIEIPARVYDEEKDMTYNVNCIGDSAFKGCADIEKVIIPETVNFVKDYAFYGCENLKDVVFSEGLRELGNFSFRRTGITSVKLPASLSFIGLAPFMDCQNLERIDVSESCRIYKSINGVLYSKTGTILIEGPTKVSAVSIPQGVKIIQDYAFDGCNLENLQLPESIEQIGNSAFRGCHLTNINLPDGLKEIEPMAFFGCPISNIFIPSSVESIGYEAFHDNPKLESITVDEANKWYKSWNNALFSKDGTVLFFVSPLTKSFIVPNGVETIESRAFLNSQIFEVVLPEGVRYIDPETFCGCEQLQNLHLPNSLENIGIRAFAGCRSLRTLVLPGNVRRLADESFADCINITEIHSYNSIPPQAGENWFSKELKSSVTVYVPKGSLNAYKTAVGWSDFPNIKEPVPTYSIHAVSINELYGTVVIENGKGNVEEGTSVTVTAKPKPGYKFTNWMEGDVVVSSENPYTFEATKDVNLVAHFAPATYKVTYMVDGKEYKVVEVTYGEAIPVEDAPTKEGYIFSGWSEIPETMPAEDIIITGTFVFDYNADAYQRLNSQIAELQNSLDAATQTINAECKDVAAQFTEQTTDIQNSIDALLADVEAKYEAGELSADSEIDIANIVAAVEKLIADAKAAQQAYEAEQAKIAANEAAYTKLMQEIAELQASLDATMEFINAECEDVAAQFAEQIASIQNAIDALLNDINAQYANCALTAESTVDAADIVNAIATMTEAATEAQKNHEEAVGIHGINGNGAKVKAIYNLNGKRVSATKPNQMYIIEYSDGRKVKATVKK